jgi:hypothetical protein
MQQHGSKCLQGPLRGTPGWWQGLGRLSGPFADPKKIKKAQRAKGDARTIDSLIRIELIERVRREIAAGIYDTQEKWEAALDRLLDNLGPT